MLVSTHLSLAEVPRALADHMVTCYNSLGVDFLIWCEAVVSGHVFHMDTLLFQNSLLKSLSFPLLCEWLSFLSSEPAIISSNISCAPFILSFPLGLQFNTCYVFSLYPLGQVLGELTGQNTLVPRPNRSARRYMALFTLVYPYPHPEVALWGPS